VFIGIPDPTNLQALDEIKFTSAAAPPAVRSNVKLAKVIDKARSG
jgi:hypothetical protein